MNLINNIIKSRNIKIINKKFIDICKLNNLIKIKNFYEDNYIDYYYKVINKNISMDLSELNKSVNYVFEDYIQYKNSNKEIILWFISLNIISNTSYNKIYNILLYDVFDKKAKIFKDMKLVL